MTKTQFFDLLNKSSFWSKDRWGHYRFNGVMTSEIVVKDTSAVEVQLKNPRDDIRLKVQSTSVRLEEKTQICGKNEWFKLRSDYFKNLKVGEFNGQTIIVIEGRIGIPV